MKMVLVKTGQTVWEVQTRLERVEGTPLTEAGVAAAHAAAGELSGKDVTAVYAGDGEPERQTAEILGEALGVKVRAVGALQGMDYGLWQGLTVDEVKRRQPKIFKQFMDMPSSVCPPKGESMPQAQARMAEGLREIVRKHKEQTVVVVLRPVMVALLQCLVEGRSLDEPWKPRDPEFRWGEFDVNVSLAPTARSRE